MVPFLQLPGFFESRRYFLIFGDYFLTAVQIIGFIFGGALTGFVLARLEYLDDNHRFCPAVPANDGSTDRVARCLLLGGTLYTPPRCHDLAPPWPRPSPPDP